MNKTEFVAAVAAKAEISKKDAEKAVAAVFGAVEDALVKGENQKADSFTIGETVYNNVNYIQYAKIDNYSALDVAGAGVTLSDGTDSLDLPAVSISADGSFAIRVFGNAITADGTYTFTPYMVTK